MKTKLTADENRLLKSFENGEWVSAPDHGRRKKELIQYARHTMKKDKRLNIRITERDLLELKKKP